MKPHNHRSTKTVFYPLFAIGIFFSLASHVTPIYAVVSITGVESGGHVIFTATGQLDINGANRLADSLSYAPGIWPNGGGGAAWYLALGPGTAVDNYEITSGDGAFGPSIVWLTRPGSGDPFLIFGAGGAPRVGVPSGYVSNAPILATNQFNGYDFASLGVTPGTYTYGIPQDTIVLNIGGAASNHTPIPAPGAFALVTLGLLTSSRYRKRLTP